MFLRRKPPQLSTLEELQQTYNDCCDMSIKNLTLEENNRIEDALKGWKSLHTSMLFKTEMFEKNAGKFSNEEKTIFQELKNIRDENVKHLIRAQLCLDEVNRKEARSSGSSKPAARPTSVSSNPGSSMTVPSLRVLNYKSSSLTNSNGSNGQRRLLKSLRPSGQTTRLGEVGATQASKAATVSWQKPSTSTSNSVSTIKTVKDTNNANTKDLFSDFDQDSFEFNDSNWERIDNSQVDLIDLDDDVGEKVHANLFNPSHFYSSDPNMENLSIEHNLENLPGLSSPSKRERAPGSSITATSKASPKLLQYASKSTSDIRDRKESFNGTSTGTGTGSGSGSGNGNGSSTANSNGKSAYVYNKPKPMNLNHLMKAPQSKSLAQKPPAKTVRSPKEAATPKMPPATAGSRPPQTAKPKFSNIAYNYKPIAPSGSKPKPRTAKSNVATGGLTTGKTTAPPKKSDAIENTPNSPTMDDILGGYDDLDRPGDTGGSSEPSASRVDTEKQQDELIASIKGIDPIAAKQILNDIVVHGDEVYWEDIVGLESAKASLKEAVVYPFLRPDLFKGLREPTRGMLLFGPPGTGKTMLARAVATESKSTFFSITSSSLTSKYLGESEKLVRALFLIAKKLAPSIVFIDEIDSLLSSRSDGDVESSRRIKNEFLVQWSELSSAAAGRDKDAGDVSRVLILGATNLPWSIDEAARRRFVRRQYIPLPEDDTRKSQIMKLLSHQKNTLLEQDYNQLIVLTQGFSGSDITALAKDSAMGPLRSLGDNLLHTPTEHIRPINLDDFKASLKYIRPSVLTDGLKQYEDWAVQFGSSGV